VFDLAATRFHVEEVPDELRIHVGVFHPEFANAPDALRMQIAFLVLDWLVGEDDVERWIGHVEPVVDDAASHLEASGLSEAIGRIASLRDPDGWATLTGEGPDGAVMAVFRHGVRWIDHPLLDLHHEVVTAFQPEANGFPDEATLEHLLTLEDDLNSTLGSSTLLVGHVTSAGTRVFHVYSDSEDQNAADGIARWCTDHDLPVSTSLDPAWRDVRPFIG
jgi:hypothetical protein